MVRIGKKTYDLLTNSYTPYTAKARDYDPRWSDPSDKPAKTADCIINVKKQNLDYAHIAYEKCKRKMKT